MADKLRIMLVDDHYLVRMGLASIIALEPDMLVCAEASTGEHIIQRLVASVGSDASASEVGLQRVQHLGATSVLADGEARPHLPTHAQRSPR